MKVVVVILVDVDYVKEGVMERFGLQIVHHSRHRGTIKAISDC